MSSSIIFPTTDLLTPAQAGEYQLGRGGPTLPQGPRMLPKLLGKALDWGICKLIQEGGQNVHKSKLKKPHLE